MDEQTDKSKLTNSQKKLIELLGCFVQAQLNNIFDKEMGFMISVIDPNSRIIPTSFLTNIKHKDLEHMETFIKNKYSNDAELKH